MVVAWEVVDEVYAEERRTHIARIARDLGRVEVTALAEELGVTTETIRRDLTALDRRGALRRVHGGAVPLERLGFEPELEARHSTMIEEKNRIAKAALDEVPEEGSILLDAGSTTSRLADALPADSELTVVTNALDIAVRLAARPHLTVLVLGGRVRRRTLAAVDVWALQHLAATYVDVAFMATNGVSTERGLTTPDPTEAAIKREMIASSRRVVLLADHTKVANDHLIRFGEVTDIDTFITDSGVDGQLADELAAAGIRMVVA